MDELTERQAQLLAGWAHGMAAMTVLRTLIRILQHELLLSPEDVKAIFARAAEEAGDNDAHLVAEIVRNAGADLD